MIYSYLSHAAPVGKVGGKAFHLLHLSKLNGITVPRWICLDTDCFYAFLGDSRAAYERLLSDGKAECGEKIRALLSGLPFPEELRAELKQALGLLHGAARLAVRSSAVDEDGDGLSFAGMMESYLDIRADDDLAAYIKKCWLSCFSVRAMAYRAQNGGISPKLCTAVIIQEMVTPDHSGVLFTVNPHTNNPDEVYISTVRGLGEGLVSGEKDSEDYVIDLLGEPVSRGGELSDEVLRELARQAWLIEDSYEVKRGCDIEFALCGERIVILQCRPIAALRFLNKRLPRTILDNSNIIESYSGVTTPLTFTFAQEVYGKIYHQTLRNFFIGEDVIAAVDDDLNHMLCFFENKIYYNLNSWYKMTSLYPRYEQNKKYMEKMMGVKTPLKETAAQSNRRLAKIYVRFLYKMLRMKHDSKRFLRRFEEVTAPYKNSRFEGKTSAEALAVYDELEHEILNDFTTPIANDMGAMVFFGLLTDSLKKHGVPDHEGLLSDILSRQGNVESAEQTEELLAIVEDIKKDPSLKKQFENGTFSLGDGSATAARLNAYIDRFGARCMDELKLETVTMQENPAFLFKTIQSYLKIEQPPRPQARPERGREGEITACYHGLGKLYIRLLVKLTKYFIRNRESLRLRRTYIYAIVRNIYLRVGKNLEAEKRLDSFRDIFFLEKDEITRIAAGEPCGDLRAKIKERKRAYEENKPKEVFERMVFYGAVTRENMLPVFSARETGESGGVLRGTPGGGKAVEGVVKLVTEPSDADINGRILMAKRTDPGWTVLFPMAKAIIIERGSVLSHSAVIAREMGIPLVVGVRGLTKKVPDGAHVRVDGINGTVTVLEEANG